MRKTVVREVLDQFAPASAVLSLYSDTDRGRRTAKEIVIALKNLNRDALRLVEDWSREDQEAMRDLLEKVFPRVEDLSKDLPRGWSFFVSPQSPPFTLPLPASVAAEASLGPRPRLFPLIQALSPFRETLVVVVESKAILFFRRYGAELTLMTRRDVEFPPRIKAGGATVWRNGASNVMATRRRPVSFGRRRRKRKDSTAKGPSGGFSSSEPGN